jgi:mono/diheme cytochrome c family protein
MTDASETSRAGESPEGPEDPGGTEGAGSPGGQGKPGGTRSKRKRWKVVLGVALVLVAVSGLYLLWRLNRDEPVEYADAAEHFKYGSTGGERLSGIPYWIWVALPELCPEHLPDGWRGRGYQSVGMIYEPGTDPRFDLPVGVSRRNVQGLDRVYLNCSVCHASTVRDAPGAEPRLVLGMPAHRFDLGAFGRFLMDCATDEKFTPDRILLEIGRLEEERAGAEPRADGRPRPEEQDLLNRLILRYLGVYLMREQLLLFRDRLDFLDSASWGPGRVDTFNAPKALLNFPMDEVPPCREGEPCELIGTADFPSIWLQRPREGMWLHWDGNNDSVRERNLSASFGTGAFPPTLAVDNVDRVQEWLWNLEPPPYPYDIDRELAARGEPLYRRYCAECHGRDGRDFANGKVGRVVRIDEIGTDRHRLDSYTPELARAQNLLYAGYPLEGETYPARFQHFRKTFGYANQPLDGIWLRAPYLHNGSVPTLADLLEPSRPCPPESGAENGSEETDGSPLTSEPEAGGGRPCTFYRGNDVYDPERVGFVSDVPQAEGRDFFLFDTRLPGNGNHGHEGPRYGTELSPEAKIALLEHLKTF